MPSQTLEGISWTLIVSIVAGSAILAWLGDVLGSKYGKQRISIFGLRPRSTSRLITALTGVFISVAVIAVMAFFFQDFRTMLFKYQYLQQQLKTLQLDLVNEREKLNSARDELDRNRLEVMALETLFQTTTASLDITRMELDRSRNDRDLLLNEKNALEASVTSLRDEAEELKQELEIRRLETVAVPANLLLGQQVVPPDTPRLQVSDLLSALNTDARQALAARFLERRMPVSEDIRVIFDAKEESDFIRDAAENGDRLYVRALAAENAAAGETVRIRLEWGRSYLLYDRGELLYRKLVDSGVPGFNAEVALHLFLRELRNSAIRSGVLPDPATNSVGSLEGEDFFEVVEKLKNTTGPVIVNAVALEDIYTEGPVRIKIELE